MKTVSIPTWAGFVLVLMFAYVLNNFLLISIPFLNMLPDIGGMTYLTTCMMILGVWSAMRGNEDRAIIFSEICGLCGVVGTTVGLTDVMKSIAADAHDMSGLTIVFVSTGHGALMATIVLFVVACNAKASGDTDANA